MRRLSSALVAVGLVSLAATGVAQAQGARFGFGGGLVAPTSDYGSLDKAGWHVLGKVDVKIPMSPVGVRLDALYGQTSHDPTFSPTGNTKLMGGLANVVFNVPLPAPMMKPYLLAGGGLYNVKISDASGSASTTKFTYDAGAGVSLGAGPLHFFVEGRYVSVRESGASMNFLPLTVGVTFGK